ncbi:MAG: MMPL family transporter [Actinomycetota bacterium]
MKMTPESLARSSSRHPWRTLAVWLVLIVTMGAVSGRLLAGVLSQDVSFTNRPESVRAQEVIDAKFGASQSEDTEFLIVHSDSLTVHDAGFESLVDRLQREVASIGGDVLAGPPATYYDALRESPDQAAALVSQDRHYTLIPVELKQFDEATIAELRRVATSAQTGSFTVQLAGQGALQADYMKIAEEDLGSSELTGIGIALIVLVVVFGSIVAALLPVVMGLFAIAVALGLVALIGQLFQFSLFVENMVTMIGLAVGIDYSLFVVSRYREERKKGFDKLEAIGAAGATANRAVFFSGLTVVLALAGMFIVPATIFRALAGGAILVTIASLAASMTLLPALLALLGDRVNWPRLSKRARVDSEHDPKGGLWDRLARGVMARPVAFLTASVLILGGLGSFYLQMNKGTSENISQLSDDFASKQAFVTLQREFQGNRTDPAKVVITGDVRSPDVQAAIASLQEGISKDPTFSPTTQTMVSSDGTTVELDVFLQGDSQNDAAVEGIRDLRSRMVPEAFQGVTGAEALVGGNPGFFVDYLDLTSRYEWIVLAFVLSLSFVLLTIVFRSIVVPVKAILMNLLSVGAAYGALTLVFQKGVGIGFFDAMGFHFQRTEAIEAWIPLFLFSVLFGLSMDYHVFLLTRIREEYDKTRDNTEAVAYGLRTTAGIITGAALIMVAVFTGFAAGRLGMLQQMGFGLGVAILMDATIVRTLLVPASMRLLGDWNWYLPKWLDWLPSVNVEGREPGQHVLRPRIRPVVTDEAEPVTAGRS